MLQEQLAKEYDDEVCKYGCQGRKGTTKLTHVHSNDASELVQHDVSSTNEVHASIQKAHEQLTLFSC